MNFLIINNTNIIYYKSYSITNNTNNINDTNVTNNTNTTNNMQYY